MVTDDCAEDQSQAEFWASMKAVDQEEQEIPFRQLSTVSGCKFDELDIVKRR